MKSFDFHDFHNYQFEFYDFHDCDDSRTEFSHVHDFRFCFNEIFIV